jgi:hypothetical protein
MVIDSGIDLSHEEISKHVKEHWSFNDLDDQWHGTAMASLVLKDTCDEIELINCNYHPSISKNELEDSNACFNRALKEDISYINYSSSGSSPDKEEEMILKKLSDKGVIIVVAAGNRQLNLMKSGKCEGSYPGCYLFKNMYIVQNIDKNGNIVSSSNYLKHPNARSEIGVDVPILLPNKGYGKTTGTSPSAAKYTNSLLLKECQKLHK